jgi:hypothetical protein
LNDSIRNAAFPVPFSLYHQNLFMKRLLAFLLLVFVFSGCRHYSQGFEAYFCTSTGSEKRSYLYIDDERIGELPYTPDVPTCEDARFSHQLLYTDLKAGSHRIQVKDTDGNILFSEKMSAGRSGRSHRISTSTRKRRWSSSVQVKEGCLIADLRF